VAVSGADVYIVFAVYDVPVVGATSVVAVVRKVTKLPEAVAPFVQDKSVPVVETLLFANNEDCVVGVEQPAAPNVAVIDKSSMANP
jgi:hypothetical protein